MMTDNTTDNVRSLVLLRCGTITRLMTFHHNTLIALEVDAVLYSSTVEPTYFLGY